MSQILLQNFYVNVTRLVTRLVVQSVRLYVDVCHVSPVSSAKRFRTTFKTPVGHSLVSRPFQVAAIEFKSYEACDTDFSYMSSHDLSDSVFR